MFAAPTLKPAAQQGAMRLVQAPATPCTTDHTTSNSVRHAVVARGLRKSYGDTEHRVDALLGVDLAVERGEIVGVLGPNGAGKTTLIEILEGLRAADAGEARVLDVAVADRAAMKRCSKRVGIAFQHSVLPPLLSVEELMAFQKSLFASRVDIVELIDAVGLTEKRSARIASLSGGQQQRVTVALALVGDPELMFLDEPTSQLDPQARRAMWAALERQRERRDAAILLTTHQMEEAQRLCGRIVVLDHGRVIAEGTPNALIDRHCPGRVVEFVTTREAPLAFVSDPMTRHDEGAASMRVRVEARDVNALIAALIDRQRDAELKVDDIRIDRQTLEDVFLKLTGRAIRE